MSTYARSDKTKRSRKCKERTCKDRSNRKGWIEILPSHKCKCKKCICCVGKTGATGPAGPTGPAGEDFNFTISTSLIDGTPISAPVTIQSGHNINYQSRRPITIRPAGLVAGFDVSYSDGYPTPGIIYVDSGVGSDDPSIPIADRQNPANPFATLDAASAAAVAAGAVITDIQVNPGVGYTILAASGALRAFVNWTFANGTNVSNQPTLSSGFSNFQNIYGGANFNISGFWFIGFNEGGVDQTIQFKTMTGSFNFDAEFPGQQPGPSAQNITISGDQATFSILYNPPSDARAYTLTCNVASVTTPGLYQNASTLNRTILPKVTFNGDNLTVQAIMGDNFNVVNTNTDLSISYGSIQTAQSFPPIPSFTISGRPTLDPRAPLAITSITNRSNGMGTSASLFINGGSGDQLAYNGIISLNNCHITTQQPYAVFGSLATGQPPITVRYLSCSLNSTAPDGPFDLTTINPINIQT